MDLEDGGIARVGHSASNRRWYLPTAFNRSQVLGDLHISASLYTRARFAIAGSSSNVLFLDEENNDWRNKKRTSAQFRRGDNDDEDGDGGRSVRYYDQLISQGIRESS